MSSWLKAGLIGAAIKIVLQLIGQIPFVCCVTLPLGLLTDIGIGALAAYWIMPPRTAGKGAGQGAVAALIASLFSQIVGLIISVIWASATGVNQVLSQLPPELLHEVRNSGIPPELLFGPAGAAAFGSICCVFSVAIAAVLGAIGGAIYAAVKPE